QVADGEQPVARRLERRVDFEIPKSLARLRWQTTANGVGIEEVERRVKAIAASGDGLESDAPFLELLKSLPDCRARDRKCRGQLLAGMPATVREQAKQLDPSAHGSRLRGFRSQSRC